MTMYVSGFDIIRLEAGRITTDQRRAIRSATRGWSASKSSRRPPTAWSFRDLLDSSELSIVNAVTRMRLIAQSMLEDAVTALIENDDDIARDVIERDDDVDRLWLVVSRIFRATLRSPPRRRGTRRPARGLLRLPLERPPARARRRPRRQDQQHRAQTRGDPEPVAEALEELHTDASTVLEKSMDALFADETGEANRLGHDAREAVLEIDEHTRQIDDMLRDLDPVQAQSLGLIVDSLSRSADYGGNIAETALQKAAPRP